MSVPVDHNVPHSLDPFARVAPEWAAGRGPMVVKLGGAAVDDPDKAPWLWSALSTLHAAHPGGLVLVHGGAVAVDRQLGALGLASERRDGIRLTPESHIGPITGVLAGSVNKALVGWMNRAGASAVGLCLGDGGLCTVRRTKRYAFDAGRVGEIVGGEGRLVHALLKEGFLPVLCSIGLDADGTPLNVNADEAAAGVARTVHASALLLLTDVPGVLGPDREVIHELDRAAIDRLIVDGTITGGMIPKVRGALEAAEASGVPVIIAAWNDPGTLETLARGDWAGTRIVPAALTGSHHGSHRTHHPSPEPSQPASVGCGAAP